MQTVRGPSCLVRAARSTCQSCSSRSSVRFQASRLATARTRQFSNTPCRKAAEAQELQLPDGQRKPARILPASPSYFTGTPDFTDNLLSLESLERKHEKLPRVEPGQAARIAWLRLPQYRALLGEPIRVSQFSRIIGILQRLNRIHPSVMPDEVRKSMELFKRPGDPYARPPMNETIDSWGRTRGVGRRKSSHARVFLVEGTGEVLVNGKTLVNAFPRIHDRESVIWALKATQRTDKYNVWALVQGGGTTGQAEALTLGLAKALMVHEPALKPALRRAGCITRDPRRVERKKPGHVKARKMPAWVKR